MASLCCAYEKNIVLSIGLSSIRRQTNVQTNVVVVFIYSSTVEPLKFLAGGINEYDRKI